MEMQGEELHVLERVVTSPAAGTFVPIEPVPDHVSCNTLLGHIRSASTVVEVRSRFQGRLVEIVAAPGQRLQPFERIAWLRVA